MNKIYSILEKYREQIWYLIFGVLTTIVSYSTYIIFTRWYIIDIGMSNILSWCISVVFAYITNKNFVFKSKNMGKKEVFIEFIKFIGSRVFSGILDTVLLIFFVNVLGINDIVMKVINGVVVVSVNYVLSKFIIFNKN